VAAENTDFWLATCTIGPVRFLAIGVLGVELDRAGGLGWTRPAQKVVLLTVNVSFIGTLLPTTTAVLSLAWGSNLLPPKALAVVIVVAVLAFWISLVAHFQDVEDTSGKGN
jgi:hypothetical protein